MILSILAFVFILGILVFVHELGHFAVAKWCGMRVDEFAIGFPPRLYAVKRGETTYAINAIPVGGYVKIYGESAHAGDPDPRSFPNKPLGKRIAVIVAGVSMNLIFAFLLLSVAYSIGFPSLGLGFENYSGAKVTRSEVAIMEVLPNSPAEKAGLQPGDYIRTIQDPVSQDAKDITTIQSMQEYTRTKQGSGHLNLTVTVDRDGTKVDKQLAIASSGPALGVAPEDLVMVKVPFWRAPQASYEVIKLIVTSTWSALKDFGVGLFAHGHLDSQVSGPVGIYHATSAAAHQGTASVIFLLAALSINLALLNILPIPALDGGKLAFLVIELVFRKRMVSERIEAAVSTLGFLALIGLILIITLRDVGII